MIADPSIVVEKRIDWGGGLCGTECTPKHCILSCAIQTTRNEAYQWLHH